MIRLRSVYAAFFSAVAADVVPVRLARPPPDSARSCSLIQSSSRFRLARAASESPASRS